MTVKTWAPARGIYIDSLIRDMNPTQGDHKYASKPIYIVPLIQPGNVRKVRGQGEMPAFARLPVTSMDLGCVGVDDPSPPGYPTT